MSARETHSCFGMEKNSTDLRSNCFVEFSSPKNVVSTWEPGCRRRPLRPPGSPPRRPVWVTAGFRRNCILWHHLESRCICIIHMAHLFYIFNTQYHQKFPDRYSIATLNERESVLLSDEWETGNVRLREEARVTFDQHTIVPTCMCPPYCRTRKKLVWVGN